MEEKQQETILLPNLHLNNVSDFMVCKNCKYYFSNEFCNVCTRIPADIKRDREAHPLGNCCNFDAHIKNEGK